MLNNLTGYQVHNQRAIVQMLDGELPPAQGGQEIDLHVDGQVAVLPLELLMWLLLEHDDDVSRYYVWCLVALARKRNRLAALHALVDVHL